MNRTYDAEVTVKFTIKNCIDKESLEECYENLEEWIRDLIEIEGLWGIVDDEYTIVKVEEA